MTERFLHSQLNQARSMMLAGLEVGAEEIDQHNRSAHPQMMKMVLPSLFLRSVIAVLAAIGISIVGNAAELPGRIVDIVSWAVVLALPAVVISLWILLTALRVKRRSIKNKIEGRDGDRLLWRASLLGYAGAAIVGGIGVFYFPNAF